MNYPNQNYSKICTHTRLTRLNENFVRCLECGQSMISHQNIYRNKSRQDFTKENSNFVRNFDRNFSNIIEETDFPDKPIYEYYIDKNGANVVIVDKTQTYSNYPIRYKVIMNGETAIMDDTQIKDILNDIRAVRIDEEQFKQILGQNSE